MSSKHWHISLISFFFKSYLFHHQFFSDKYLKIWEAIDIFPKVRIFVFKTQILLLPINTVVFFEVTALYGLFSRKNLPDTQM